MLNKTLQKKWLPEKTVKQKRQMEKESEARAKNKLKQGPVERGKSRKKAKKIINIVRIMEQQPITLYTWNANHITNKIPTVVHTTHKENLDVIHITEAGLKQKLPDIMKGYKAVIHKRPEHNRGSVMWVKDYYHDRMVGIDDQEDKNIGSEIIHILLDILPPANIRDV